MSKAKMADDDGRRSKFEYEPPPRFVPPKTLAESKIFLLTRIEELIKYVGIYPQREIAKKTLDLHQRLLKQLEEFSKYHAESSHVAFRTYP